MTLKITKKNHKKTFLAVYEYLSRFIITILLGGLLFINKFPLEYVFIILILLGWCFIPIIKFEDEEDLKPIKKFKHVKVNPDEIHINFKTTSGKDISFKAIRPKEDVKIK